MPLKTIVKVGNITNLSDARYSAGMGADMLGFNVDEGNENYISPENYQQIRGWVSGPAVVAEIYNSAKANWPSIVKNYAPDFLELDVTDLENVAKDNKVSFILRATEKTFSSSAHLQAFKTNIAYILLRESECSIDFINSIAKEFSVLLVPGQDADINVILDKLPIKGIALNGSHETKPGLKDYDHLANVLEQLDVD